MRAFEIPYLIVTPDSSVYDPLKLPSCTLPENVTLKHLAGSNPSMILNLAPVITPAVISSQDPDLRARKVL